MSYQIEITDTIQFENSELNILAIYELYDHFCDEGLGLCLHDEPNLTILYNNFNVTKLMCDFDPDWYRDLKKELLNKAKEQVLESFKNQILYLP